MNVMKKLMVVLRIVPTPLDHTLAAAVLAIVLVVMDTPAMVLSLIPYSGKFSREKTFVDR